MKRKRIELEDDSDEHEVLRQRSKRNKRRKKSSSAKKRIQEDSDSDYVEVHDEYFGDDEDFDENVDSDDNEEEDEEKDDDDEEEDYLEEDEDEDDDEEEVEKNDEKDKVEVKQQQQKQQEEDDDDDKIDEEVADVGIENEEVHEIVVQEEELDIKDEPTVHFDWIKILRKGRNKRRSLGRKLKNKKTIRIYPYKKKKKKKTTNSKEYQKKVIRVTPKKKKGRKTLKKKSNRVYEVDSLGFWVERQIGTNNDGQDESIVPPPPPMDNTSAISHEEIFRGDLSSSESEQQENEHIDKTVIIKEEQEDNISFDSNNEEDEEVKFSSSEEQQRDCSRCMGYGSEDFEQIQKELIRIKKEQLLQSLSENDGDNPGLSILSEDPELERMKLVYESLEYSNESRKRGDRRNSRLFDRNSSGIHRRSRRRNTDEYRYEEEDSEADDDDDDNDGGKYQENYVSKIQSSGDVDSKFRRLLSKRTKKIKISRSPIHSWGGFAMEEIKKGEFIVEYMGEVTRSTVAEIRERQYKKIGMDCSFLFKIDENYVIDATLRGNKARFLNHSCDPNCSSRVIYSKENQIKQPRVVIYAFRDIKIGEELTYDYKFEFEGDKEAVPCLCGSKKCRGRLN